MEPTSHYHYPILKAFQDAALPVCLVNPYQLKKYGDTALRKAKTDKKDAVKIAQYALEKSYTLTSYTPQDQKVR
jgi:Transposase.